MDYSKCVIYKITCCDESVLECYVGHTTNFVKRKHQHKTYYNNEKCNFKVYQMIRDHGGWDNWMMTPICEYPCENHIQACIKEEEYRVELQAKLNMKKCYADSQTEEYQKLYYEDNKEIIAKKKKIYRKTHKEIIDEQNKEYRESNKEQIAERNKKYRESNKEQILEKKKIYRESNKEQIAEKKRLKYQQKKLVQTEK